MKFALLFMAEYDKMIAICTIAASLFFGGYREFWFLKDTILGVDQTPLLGPVYLFLKIFILLFGMIWVRATLPRIRYDRLMAFGWKILLPLSLALIFLTATGILLKETVSPLFYSVGIPLASLAAGGVAILGMYQTLRRKEHART
jgi:NADH-quinone oxidoreductase subunit H